MKSVLKIFLIICVIFAQISPVFAQKSLRISSNYGLRNDPFSGKLKFHEGIDIPCPTGTPVYSMQDGYVTKSAFRGGYGLAVTVDHYYPDVPQIPRLQTTYGHCSRLLVNVGDYVRRGQVIALSGSTGRSNGPHLHFEVTYKGRSVDPKSYFAILPSYLDFIKKVRANRKYV